MQARFDQWVAHGEGSRDPRPIQQTGEELVRLRRRMLEVARTGEAANEQGSPLPAVFSTAPTWPF